MEAIKEAFLSGNVVAWVIAVVAIMILIHLLKRAGKIVIVIAAVGGFFFVASIYFPGFIDPMVEFVQGGWMGGQ